MSTLVKSLKRLYEKGKITEEKIRAMVETEEITAEDYEYITGEPYKAKKK